MKPRAVAVAAAAICGASSYASFELMLVANSQNGTIQRYDAETGTSFGSFGFGFNITKITANKAANTVYALYNGNTVRRFNYNTGSYLGEFVLSGSATDIFASNDGTRLLVASGTKSILSYSPSTGAFQGTFYTSAYINIGTIGEKLTGPAGFEYMFGTTASSGIAIELVSAAGTLFTTYSGVASPIAAVSASGGIADGLGFATANNSAYVGAYPSGIGGTIVSSIFSAVKAAAPAHFGVYFAGTNTAGTGGVIAQFATNGGYLRQYDTVAGTTVSGMTTVIAPEPGSMLALALGAGLLARRRRARGK